MENDPGHENTRRFAFIIALFTALLVSGWMVGMDFCHKGKIADINIEEKINPNCDNIESLMRLPAVGPVRAAKIIEYRQQLNGDSGRAFEDINDLLHICRIGSGKAEVLKQYLEFE